MTNVALIKNIVLLLSTFLYIFLTMFSRNQYIYDMSYIKCIIFMVLLSIMIYTYGIFKNDDKAYKNNILTYIGVFILLLFSITFILKRPQFRIYNWMLIGQHIPFKTIIGHFKNASLNTFLKNILGNLVMLVPLSFLLMLKSKRFDNIIRQTPYLLLISLLIEILQAFSHVGVFDVDDIFLNYLGCLIFFFIITAFKLKGRMRNLFYTDFNLNHKYKLSLFLGSIVALAGYIIFLFNL